MAGATWGSTVCGAGCHPATCNTPTRGAGCRLRAITGKPGCRWWASSLATTGVNTIAIGRGLQSGIVGVGRTGAGQNGEVLVMGRPGDEDRTGVEAQIGGRTEGRIGDLGSTADPADPTMDRDSIEDTVDPTASLIAVQESFAGSDRVNTWRLGLRDGLWRKLQLGPQGATAANSARLSPSERVVVKLRHHHHRRKRYNGANTRPDANRFGAGRLVGVAR